MDDLTNTINNVVREAVVAKTQAAVIEAFGGTDKLIGALISATLNQKVQVNYRDVTYLQKVSQEVIAQGVKDALSDLVNELKPEIKKELRKRIQADRDSIVDALMMNLNTAGKNAGWYRVRVSFEPNEA